jgi:UDP-3-O-[3-hydroxymyristoyl] glucosamine N-acyltransferase
MKLEYPISIKTIAERIDAKIIGNPDTLISHLCEIHNIESGSLIFIDNEKYYNQAIYSSANAIILNREVECPPNKALLVVSDPFEAYNNLALYFSPPQVISKSVSDSAIIGKGTIIEHGAVLGNFVTIGDNCHIKANVVLMDHTKIGNNVLIHAGTVVGSDAFYMNKQADNSYKRWHSIGKVIIEDDVEIGANCTIDKGVSGDTIIGTGSKIDNLVHLGHGVEIGSHCLIAAQVGIAGKTVIQDNVTIYGQVGIAKSLVVGEGAVLLPKTGVSKSIPGGDRQYIGIPAAEARSKFREIAATRQLPDLISKVNELYNLFIKKKER